MREIDEEDETDKDENGSADDRDVPRVEDEETVWYEE